MLTLFALILVLIGCANWLTIGLLQFDFVAGLFGSQSNIFSRIVYVIVGVAAVILTVNIIKNKGKLAFNFKKLKFNKKAEPRRRLATAKAESAEDFSKDEYEEDDYITEKHLHENNHEYKQNPQQKYRQEAGKDNYNNRYKDFSNKLSEQHKNNNSHQ